MKRTLAVILSVAAVSAAVPAIANAQPYGGRERDQRGQYQPGFGQYREIQQLQARLAVLDDRIRQGFRTGHLVRPEFNRLSKEADDVRYRLARAARSGRGLDFNERRDIERRIDRLDQHIRTQWHDRNQRRDRGWDDRGDYRR